MSLFPSFAFLLSLSCSLAALLDDLDRELNNFAMRLKEWYGWHFPELGKIVTDNLVYAKTVQLLGFRTNAKHTEFSSLLPEEVSPGRIFNSRSLVPVFLSPLPSFFRSFALVRLSACANPSSRL